MLVTSVIAVAGCMVTTISKDYSADEVESNEKLSFNKVDNLDDIESFDKSAIPVVVKSESTKEELYSPGGIHGLLWLCTLGIIPSWQTEAETHTMNVATPLGEKSGVCTVTKRRYWGWVPYMLPFGSSNEDAQCEEELLSRLASQWKKEWSAENVEKMNSAKVARMKELRVKADNLLAQKKWAEVVNLCKVAKNKAFASEYLTKTKNARLTIIKQETEVAMDKKDYKRVIDLLKGEEEHELVIRRDEAIVNLIASCVDETKFNELMVEYGEALTMPQLVEIANKNTKENIKLRLVEITDRKIAKQIEKLYKQITDDYKEEEDRLIHEQMTIGNNIRKLLGDGSYGGDVSGKYVEDFIRQDAVGSQVLNYFYRGDGKDSIDAQLASWKIKIDNNHAARLPQKWVATINEIKREMGKYRAKELALQQASEQNALKMKRFTKLIGMLQSEKAQVEVVKKYDPSDFRALVPKLAPVAIVSLYEGKTCSQHRISGPAINEESSESKVLFESIPRGKLLECLSVFTSRGHDTRYIVSRLKAAGDTGAIINRIVELLNSNKISEIAVAEYVKKLDDGETTIALYNVVKGQELKQLIFSKLCSADRESIREGNVAKCKQIINFAKSRSKETFEMHGFYLGMSIDDVELLVMHYFPDLEAKEERDKDGEYKLDISDCDSPFCWANKDRKVYQFDFSKNMLKKWYKYDASTIRDWAKAYSREHGIDLELDFINRSDEVYLPNAMFQLVPYHVSLNQAIWTYKNGMKNYRLTYFGEREFGGGSSMVKSVARDKYSFVSASEGTFRAAIEND